MKEISLKLPRVVTQISDRLPRTLQGDPNLFIEILSFLFVINWNINYYALNYPKY